MGHPFYVYTGNNGCCSTNDEGEKLE